MKEHKLDNDFDDIYIDDPRFIPRRHKIDVFREILLNAKREAHEIWVIGFTIRIKLEATMENIRRWVNGTEGGNDLRRATTSRIQ